MASSPSQQLHLNGKMSARSNHTGPKSGEVRKLIRSHEYVRRTRPADHRLERPDTRKCHRSPEMSGLSVAAGRCSYLKAAGTSLWEERQEKRRRVASRLKLSHQPDARSKEPASIASEPRERSAPAKRRARERVGESEGRSPSDKTRWFAGRRAPRAHFAAPAAPDG